MPWPDVLVIIFGLVIGSFLNVCIYRLPRHRTVVLSRSRCPHCDTPLKPWENIPLLSFLLLRGRCGTCGGAISWTYPLVEGLSALLFYLLFLKYHFGYPFFVNLVFFAMLVVLSFVDLYERILPDIATLGGLVVGLAVSPLQSERVFRRQYLLFHRVECTLGGLPSVCTGGCGRGWNPLGCSHALSEDPKDRGNGIW